jgi:hypothetical protein
MARTKEINLNVGKGTHKGSVRLSALLPEVLTLSVSYKGERAATVTLTGEQVRQLRRALDKIASQVAMGGEERLRLAA